MIRYIHIFRTKFQSEQAFLELSELLNTHPHILRWNVDLEDVDNILKIETHSLTEESIIALAQEKRIVCEVLPD